jgi:hypothetical protein
MDIVALMEILITRNVNQPSMTLIGREATNFALFSPLVQVSIELLTLLYPEKGKKANSCSLLPTCTGGLGINLQTADTCILYDR